MREELGLARRPRHFRVDLQVWAQPGDDEQAVTERLNRALRAAGCDAIVHSVCAGEQSPYASRKFRITTERSS